MGEGITPPAGTGRKGATGAVTNQSVRETLAVVLRSSREKARLTVYEVGEKIGKSGKTVSGWENGRGQPDAEMLLKLCELYQVPSIGVFFGETVAGLTEEEASLVRLYRSLSDTGRFALRCCAQGLKDGGAFDAREDPDAGAAEVPPPGAAGRL